MIRFTQKVGVAPGTTMMQLGRRWDPYTDMISLNDTFVPAPIQDRPIRWDLVAIVGGGSAVFALAAAFIASALRHRL